MTHRGENTPFLADISAWTGAAEETLRIATHSFSTMPSDAPPNVGYLGIITDIGVVERSIFADKGITGSPNISAGYIELANTGRLDSWLNYGFDGRRFVIARLGQPARYANRRTVFTGTMIGLDASNAWTKLRIKVRDRLQELDRPLLTVRYAGTTTSTGPTAEGNEDLKDTLKPMIFGTVRNITPKLVNPYDLIWQVSNSSVASIAVKWGGQALAYAGDQLTIEALQSASIPTAQYATCLSQGLFRSANSPSTVVTADVVEGSSAANRSVAQIARRMLQYYGVTDLDLASFTNADAFNDAGAGIYIDNDTTALTLVSGMLDSLGYAVVPDLTGAYGVVMLREPAGLTSTASFDLNDVASGQSLALLSGPGDEGEGVPAFSMELTYDRNWTQLDLSQVAGILTDAEKDALAEKDKTTSAVDNTVKTAHPLAAALSKDTYLATSADAQAEVARLLALYKVRRDRIAVTIDDVAGENVELGDCVTLTLNRFGFDSGKKFLVLGRREEFRTRTVTLNLWG